MDVHLQRPLYRQAERDLPGSGTVRVLYGDELVQVRAADIFSLYMRVWSCKYIMSADIHTLKAADIHVHMYGSILRALK